ncbi:MAG: amidohydrolase family protein [Cyclobacteriaceae bacterium]
MRHFYIALVLLTQPLFLQAQQEESEPTMSFEEYNPKSSLVVPENIVKKAKYPFIDVHNHQWNLKEEGMPKLISEMNSLNMATMVNLSGRGFNRFAGDVGSQDYLKGMIDLIGKTAENRMVVFTNISFKDIGQPGWTENAVRQLEEDVKNGASGLKIYKSLGLRTEDSDGNRVPVNDKRLDPIWAKCGELGIPVLIHSADPALFWQPMDKDNERWLELKLRPGRKRGPDNPVPFEQIMAEQHDVFAKHPNTTFINAHFGWMANDLQKLGEFLESYPNVYVEIGAIIAELGRQPKMANWFFEKYQDRVLFGKDSYRVEEYYTYFRVLETGDEYFPYYKKYHAYWRMYGLALPDHILKKLYYKNALKIIPNINKNLFPE